MGKINSKAEGPAPQAFVQATWLFKGDSGFQCYSPANTAILEDNYQLNPAASFCLIVNGATYQIDLGKMLQINSATTFACEIMRVGPPSKAAALVTSTSAGRWEWKEGDIFCPYGPVQNAALENAYLAKQMALTLLVGRETFAVYLNTMRQVSAKGRVVEIRRTEPIPISLLWEWQNNNEFQQYSSDVSQKLENAKNSGQATCSFTWNGLPCTADLTLMQVTSAKKVSAIRRSPSLVTSAPTHPETAQKSQKDQDSSNAPKPSSPDGSQTAKTALANLPAEETKHTAGLAPTNAKPKPRPKWKGKRDASPKGRALPRSQIPISPPTATLSGSECKLTKLRSDSLKYHGVKREFDKTMEGKYTTLDVTEVSNSILMGYLSNQKEQIKALSKGAKPKVMLLFHGTSDTDPAKIYNGCYEGFDTQHAADSGFWGRGLYFAVNASYSHAYAHQNAEEGVRQLFLAEVIVGKSCDFKDKHDSTLKHPPSLPGDDKKRYDSVKATTEGSDVYVIYDGKQAYPKYLLSYK